jgi:hypothetical protein
MLKRLGESSASLSFYFCGKEDIMSLSCVRHNNMAKLERRNKRRAIQAALQEDSEQYFDMLAEMECYDREWEELAITEDVCDARSGYYDWDREFREFAHVCSICYEIFALCNCYDDF